MIFLSGRRINLRPYDKDRDLKNVLKWNSDPDSRLFMSTFMQFPRIADIEEKNLRDLASSTSDCFFILETKEGDPIGSMAIHKIDWINRTAQTGALIGEKTQRNKGYGTDAKMILLNYAFNTLNLRKINSSVHSFNKRSLTYNLKCGFKIEGSRRKQYFRDGKYWDEIIISVFKKDFMNIWKNYQRQE